MLACDRILSHGHCQTAAHTTPLRQRVQAFSLLLSNISYRGSAAGKLDTEDATHRDFSPTDGQVLVRDGTLLTGMLDKKALGDGGGGLIHIIFNEDGWHRCAAFIGEVQFVVNYWLTHRGFSVGIGDTVADAGTMAKIGELIADAKAAVQEIIKQYQGGGLEEKPGRCEPWLCVGQLSWLPAAPQSAKFNFVILCFALCFSVNVWHELVARACHSDAQGAHLLRAVCAGRSTRRSRTR